MALNRTRDSGNDQELDTATRILDVAERLVQLRGFNGFSYADIAAELHITKASLHYHYAGKSELGRALIDRYAGRFTAALDAIDQHETDPIAKIRAYEAIYADVLSERRMCLCGMLAAGYDTLAEPMQQAVIEFFDANETWLTRVLEEGQESGNIKLNGPAREAAQLIVSGLEGAMLIARPYDDVQRFNAAADRLLPGLVP